MAERINKDEFVRRVAKRMKANQTTAQVWVDAVLDTMYNTFRDGKGGVSGIAKNCSALGFFGTGL